MIKKSEVKGMIKGPGIACKMIEQAIKAVSDIVPTEIMHQMSYAIQIYPQGSVDEVIEALQEHKKKIDNMKAGDIEAIKLDEKGDRIKDDCDSCNAKESCDTFNKGGVKA